MPASAKRRRFFISPENKAADNLQNSPAVFKEIRKRDGRIVPFDPEKITEAIFKAARAVGGTDRTLALQLTATVQQSLQKKLQNNLIPTVEEVQDEVEIALIENGHARTAKAYILYRDKRTRIRDRKSELMDVVKDILAQTSPEPGFKNSPPAAKMLQIAKAASKQYYLSNLIPAEFARAYEEGLLYMHNLEYYSKALNTLQIELCRLFKTGFTVGRGFLAPPERIGTACLQAAVILNAAQSDLPGGRAIAHFDRSLGEAMRSFKRAPSFEELSRAMEDLLTHFKAAPANDDTRLPQSTLNLGSDTTVEGRTATRALLEAFGRSFKAGKGSASACLVFRLQEDINLNPQSPNYDLYQLALKTALKGSGIAFSFMDSIPNRPGGDEASYFSCGSRAFAGRANIAAASINLVRLALKSKGQPELFFIQLERLLNLAARQLLHRFEVLSRLSAKDLPFLVGQKLLEGADKLQPKETIREIIKQGTLEIGFCGLAEALKVLYGYTHAEDRQALQAGLKIVRHLKQRLEAFGDEYALNFSLSAASLPGCAEYFLSKDLAEFGAFSGVTDKLRYSSSFQLPADGALQVMEKIKTEGQFHRLCKGGHLSCADLNILPVEGLKAADQIVRAMRAAGCAFGLLKITQRGSKSHATL